MSPEARGALRRNSGGSKMPIVIQKFYPVDIGAERADRIRNATFRGRTRKEQDFLFETVRG